MPAPSYQRKASTEVDPASRQLVQRLFLEHQKELRGFLLGMCPDRTAADDLLQETFLTAVAKAESFVPGTHFLAWVRTIARFKLLEHRHRTAKGAVLSSEAWEALAEAVDEIDDTWDARRQALAECMGQLAGRSRQLIELRYSPEHFDLAQIAATLGWTLGAVKVGLSRARDALWRCVEKKTAFLQPSRSPSEVPRRE